jgi:hypothetical protein
MSAVIENQNIYRCFNCKAVIGVCTANELIIATSRFQRPVTIQCLMCKRMMTWRPSEQKTDSK